MKRDKLTQNIHNIRANLNKSAGVIFQNENILFFIIFIVIAIILTVQLIFLTNFPTIFIDEPWYANAAWNWLKNGINFDSMHSSTLEQYGIKTTAWPIIGNFFYAASFRLFGLGLFQARIVSWFFGVFLLVVIYYGGKFIYGKLTGGLAALFLALSFPFIQASHYARPDIILATAIMLSFTLTIYAIDKDKRWVHFLAGILVSISLDIHQNAVIFLLATFILYFAYFRFKVFKYIGFWFFLLGAGIGTIYFIAINIIPNLQVYTLSIANTHEIPLLTLNPIVLLKSLRDEIGRYHFFEYNLEFALIGSSLIYIFFRNKKWDRTIILFLATTFLGFVLIIGNKHDIYSILLYPFLMLISAETLVSLARINKGSFTQQTFFVSLIFLVIFINLIQLVRPLTNHREYDYDSLEEKIRSVIPQDSTVMGLPNYWIGLNDYNYQSSLNLTFFHLMNDDSLTEALYKIKPDYFIVDAGFRSLLVDKNPYQTGSGFNIYKLPKDEFYNFLFQHGKMIFQFSDPWHGEIKIYHISWNE